MTCIMKHTPKKTEIKQEKIKVKIKLQISTHTLADHLGSSHSGGGWLRCHPAPPGAQHSDKGALLIPNQRQQVSVRAHPDTQA